MSPFDLHCIHWYTPY